MLLFLYLFPGPCIAAGYTTVVKLIFAEGITKDIGDIIHELCIIPGVPNMYTSAHFGQRGSSNSSL